MNQAEIFFPEPPRPLDIPDNIGHPIFRQGYEAAMDDGGYGLDNCEYDLGTNDYKIWIDGFDYAGLMSWDYAENQISGPATMTPQFKFRAGMKIKFRRDIYSNPKYSSPELLARKGMEGEIVDNERWDGYWVSSALWPKLGARIEYFEPI